MFTTPHAIRSLRKSPAYALTAVALIAVGVAASTCAFTIVNTLFFKPRNGIAEPARLYNVHPARKNGSFGSWSYPHFAESRRELASFTGLSAFTGFEAGLAHGQRSLAVKAMLTSANYFEVLGTRPAHGRFFVPADEASIGASPVAVISHRLWQSEFNGSPDTIGSVVRVNGESFTVVGVAPAGFHGTFIGFDMDLWMPLAMARVTGSERDLSDRDAHWLEVLGRLQPGATVESARAELQQRYTAAGGAALKPSGYDNGGFIALLPNRPIDDDLRGSALGFAGALAAIAGLVLVVACINVSGLLLARAEERRRESAVRLALGASRRQLILQWMTESLALFALGGGAGLLLSVWIADLGVFRQPTQFIPLSFEFETDFRVFAFCFGVTAVCGLLAGLAPALRSARTDVVADVKSGGYGASRTGRARHALVATQLAFAVVPLVAAGLFARTLEKAAAISPGFSAESLLSVPVTVGHLGDFRMHAGPVSQRLLDTARATPGVESATIASRLPLGTGSLNTHLKAPDSPLPQADEGVFASLTYIDDTYFSTLEIPLLAGRGFRAGEGNTRETGVVVLGETLAHKLYGSPEAALGREIHNAQTRLTVIGIARDVKYSRLWEKPRDQFYLPLANRPRPRLVLAVRTSAPHATVAPALFEALRAAQPDLPLNPPLLGSEQIAITVLPQKLGARIATVLAGVSLALAVAGLYGVLALGVVRESREFGIRSALGASRLRLAGVVARRVGVVVLAGGLAGGLLSYALSRLLTGFLHGVAPFDPATYAAALGLLALAALAASWLPAWRAAKANPLEILRAD